MAEPKSSVLDKVRQFEKQTSPTSGSGPTSSNKVAELRARLEKASPTSAAAPKPNVIRSNSTSKLNTSSADESSFVAETPKTTPVVSRVSSAPKLNTSVVEESPKTTPQVVRSASSTKLATPTTDDVETKSDSNSGTKVPAVASDVPKSTPPLPRASSVPKLAPIEVVQSEQADDTIAQPAAPIPKVASMSKLAPTEPPQIKSENVAQPAEGTINRVSSTASLPKVSSTASLPKASSRDDLLKKTDSEKGLTLKIDDQLPEPPVKGQSPTGNAASRLLLAADMLIPPTVEQQDYYVLWGLSFVVPFFLLRFVFELVRKFVLGPMRISVRFAPGGNKFLSYLYVKLGPLVVTMVKAARERLPPMDAVNAKAKAGLEKFLATMQTAGGAAWPHLLHLAESIKTMRFREAATETIAVLKAWAPMLLLLIPLTKNAILAARHAWIVFWKVSKTAIYLPFGSFLRGAVKRFGQTLSENPDVFAERVAGLLGPIFGAFVSFIVLFGVGVTLGLVDYQMLSSMHLAWLFKLLGMVSEPSLLDQANLRVGDEASIVSAAASAVLDQAAAAAAAAGSDATAGAAGGQGGGFVW